MVLTAVQAGNYKPASTENTKPNTKTEEFYTGISSAATKTEEANDSKVIGLTMIPYEWTNTSYGMKAQYAVNSTPQNPIIQVTSNYGGETVSYYVNVKEVNPKNASQLEMFALLSYTDDQGMSDGGTFDSYHQLKVYSQNAQLNGYCDSLEGYDTFLNTKFDWLEIMEKMMNDYLDAGIYEQFKSCQNLLGTMTHRYHIYQNFDIKDMVMIDRTHEASLTYQGPKLSLEVNRAWIEACNTMEENGMSMDNDKRTHFTSLMMSSILKWQNNVQEVSYEEGIIAAINAAKEALADMEDTPKSFKASEEIQTELAYVKSIYETFISKLEWLLDTQSSCAEEQNTMDISYYNRDTDYSEIISEEMEKIYEKVQSGNTEPVYRIGAQTFTEKQWNEFLEQFDSIEEAIEECLKEQKEKCENEELLFSPSTSCISNGDVNDKENKGNDTAPVRYISWYTSNGIYCRKEGQTEGYEWTIQYESVEQYEKVLSYIGQLPSNDNLQFTASEKFWREFLNE